MDLYKQGGIIPLEGVLTTFTCHMTRLMQMMGVDQLTSSCISLLKCLFILLTKFLLSSVQLQPQPHVGLMIYQGRRNWVKPGWGIVHPDLVGPKIQKIALLSVSDFLFTVCPTNIQLLPTPLYSSYPQYYSTPPSNQTKLLSHLELKIAVGKPDMYIICTVAFSC